MDMPQHQEPDTTITGVHSPRALLSLLRNSREVLMTVDANLNLTWYSSAAATILGWESNEHIGRSLLDLASPDDHERLNKLLDLATSKTPCEGTYRIKSGASSFRSLEAKFCLYEENQILISHRDPAAIEEAAQRRHLATHDQLTGLSTRPLYVEALNRAILRSGRSNRHVAAMFLDLDGFQEVNDGLGHDAGDELLVQVADRLTAALRSTDIVARLSGDSFVILLEDLTERSDVELVAAKLVESIDEPFFLSQGEADISASIGVAVTADSSLSAEDLMSDADAAMYHVKAHGKNNYKLYDELLRTVAADRKDLKAALQTALLDGQFRVYYQPIVNMFTGSVASFDVSLRWDHPLRGELPIGEWVTLAEEVGLIIDIDRWVIRSACEQAAVWQAEYPEHADLVMWVEVSTRQLLREDFVDTVAEVLKSTDGQRGSIGIALRESSLAKNPSRAQHVLSALSDLGVRLELEEFSGGRFSPSQLQELPFDTVKLDRALTENLGQSPKVHRALAGIVALCRHLELDVVAKGIDNITHLTTILQLQCNAGLGKIFANPLPPDEASIALETDHQWAFHKNSSVLTETSDWSTEGYRPTAPSASIEGLGSPAVTSQPNQSA